MTILLSHDLLCFFLERLISPFCIEQTRRISDLVEQAEQIKKTAHEEIANVKRATQQSVRDVKTVSQAMVQKNLDDVRKKEERFNKERDSLTDQLREGRLEITALKETLSAQCRASQSMQAANDELCIAYQESSQSAIDLKQENQGLHRQVCGLLSENLELVDQRDFMHRNFLRVNEALASYRRPMPVSVELHSPGHPLSTLISNSVPQNSAVPVTMENRSEVLHPMFCSPTATDRANNAPPSDVVRAAGNTPPPRVEF